MNPTLSGSGFDQLQFVVQSQGAVLVNQTFSSPSAAQTFFQDQVLDLGAIPSSASPLNLSIALTVTTHQAGAGFNTGLLVGNVATANLAWTGPASVWDSQNTQSWLSGGTASSFFAGDSVTVGDTGPASIDIQGSVQPSAVSVSSSRNITLGGDGSIGGYGGLLKTGTGTLTIATSNTYSGGTTTSSGTIQVTGTLANNGSNKVFVAKDADGVFGDGNGDAVITRRVGTGGAYAGLGSSITNLDAGDLPTTADILDGSASAQADVSMAWRTRTAAEKTPAGGGLISEVLNLSGMAPYGTGTHDGSHQTDMFVLQMRYDPAQLSSIWGLTESQALAQDGLYLGYLDLGPDGIAGTADDYWTNAVYGNFGGTPNFVGNQPYNSSCFVLGDYGVDATNHTVWAVLDHNSQFAVVPEPPALALLAAGAMGLAACLRRRAVVSCRLSVVGCQKGPER